MNKIINDTKALRRLANGYYWCSVGGNPLEPCEVITKPDTAVYEARTIGCPDPFNLLDPECPLVLFMSEWDKEHEGDKDFGPHRHRLNPPRLPVHMGGEKPIPSLSHGWRGPRQH